jgi:hypothetical protein
MGFPAGAAADSTILESGMFPVNGRPGTRRNGLAALILQAAVLLLLVPAISIGGLIMAAT